MCSEDVNNFQPTLNFVPNWFITSKMIKKLFTDLYADENILYFDENVGNVLFNCNQMGILNINLILILMIILMKMILILLFMSDFWLGISNLKNTNHFKKI